jgi:cytochrome c553
MPHADITMRRSRAAPLLLMAWLPVPVPAAAADLTSQAAALTPDVPHGMVLFMKHCTGCHGRKAWGDGPREIPALAGQRAAYLIAQLAHFIDGGRPGSELHGPAMHESLQPPDVNRAQALRDLAGWLSQAAPNREPEHGTGQALASGKRAYTRACAGCHGTSGDGRDSPPVPALASQHYSYLRTQLRNLSTGQVAHAPGLGPEILGPAEQQQALADYASRLTPATPPAE